MQKLKLYTEFLGKVVEAGSQFEHVMAIALDPRTHYKEGVIRCVVSREGDIAFKGAIDRSELHKVVGDSLDHFKIGEKLYIKNEIEIIDNLCEKNQEFIGLEDPDIWIDEKTNLMHMYFTLPLINKTNPNKTKVHLGHAVGKDIDSLEMTMPVLVADEQGGAKELAIAPLNQQGVRLNLVESSVIIGDTYYSVVRIAIARDMGEAWEFGKIVFHPNEHNIDWIAGHASPGPFFPKNFIDVGSGKLLGFMNGCEANKKIGNKTKYGTFSIGLFIYDYENGEIDWVSEKPFIQDSSAGEKVDRAITFASQFVKTSTDEGILYAHVDDSFIRAYKIEKKFIKQLLPNQK